MKTSKNDPKYSKGYSIEYSMASPESIVIINIKRIETAYSGLAIGLKR